MADEKSSEGRDRGAVLLEFVLVIPIFIFVLYALISFGVALSLKEDVTHAAAEGARAAIGVPVNPAQSDYFDTTCAPSTTPVPESQPCQAEETAALNRAKAVLGWLGSNAQYLTITPSVTACSGDPSNQCITVKITYPYGDHPVIPNAPGIGVINPSELSSTAVVQVQ